MMLNAGLHHNPTLVFHILSITPSTTTTTTAAAVTGTGGGGGGDGDDGIARDVFNQCMKALESFKRYVIGMCVCMCVYYYYYYCYYYYYYCIYSHSTTITTIKPPLPPR